MSEIYRPTPPVNWTWISQIGPDAQDFLHRLTTVNVKTLKPGHGTRGCFLTAQGKIRAFFNLWCYGPGEYAFEMDSGPDGRWKHDLLSLIDQFTFSEKFVLTEVKELACLWVFGESLDGLGTGETRALEGEVRVCHHGEADFGRPWLTVWARPDRLEAWAQANLKNQKEVDFVTIDAWRIQALSPWIDTEITDATIPLEVGLRDAVSDNKGCYPGQEVIERIIALGAPARRLARIDGQGTVPHLGDKIFNLATPPLEVGQVTSITGDTHQFTALGFIRKIHAKDGLEVKFQTEGSQAKIIQVSSYV